MTRHSEKRSIVTASGCHKLINGVLLELRFLLKRDGYLFDVKKRGVNMESTFWRVVTSLGVPGLALGVFYMIYVTLDLPPLPSDWVGPITLVYLLLAAAITFKALGPRNPTNVVTHVSDNRISSERQNALNAVWSGELKQPPRPITGVKLTLKVTGKDIQGEMQCTYAVNDVQNFDVSGSFLDGHFLKLDYANKDKGAVHFGTCLFDLKADGRTLIGKCVGYGIRTQEIVTADLELIRQA